MEEGALIFRCIYVYVLVRESVKTETTRGDPKEDVEERRRVLLLKAFLGSLRARSKDRAIDTSSPQSTGDRLDLRTTSNNNNNKKEREKKNRCNNRKSMSTLLTLRCSRGTIVV